MRISRPGFAPVTDGKVETPPVRAAAPAAPKPAPHVRGKFKVSASPLTPVEAPSAGLPTPAEVAQATEILREAQAAAAHVGAKGARSA